MKRKGKDKYSGFSSGLVELLRVYTLSFRSERRGEELTVDLDIAISTRLAAAPIQLVSLSPRTLAIG